MSTTTAQTVVPLWRYHCNECGFGDAELGHQAPDHAIYCEVCLEDEGYVRLRRWVDEPSKNEG